MSNENSAKVSDDVLRAIYVDLSGNAKRKIDGVETGKRITKIDEERMEAEKDTIKTDGGFEISK